MENASFAKALLKEESTFIVQIHGKFSQVKFEKYCYFHFRHDNDTRNQSGIYLPNSAVILRTIIFFFCASIKALC